MKRYTRILGWSVVTPYLVESSKEMSYCRSRKIVRILRISSYMLSWKSLPAASIGMIFSISTASWYCHWWHWSAVEEQIDTLLFCSIFLRIWKAKSSSQLGAFFPRCLPIELELKTMLARVSERENFFSLNCSKFAVESDCNSKISQNVQSLAVFGKIDGFFRKSTWIFFKNR